MQFTIDSAKKNYVLRTSLADNSKENKQPVIVNSSKTDRDVTLLDKSTAFLAGAAISSIVSNLKQTNSKFFLTSLEKLTALPTFDETKNISERMLENMKLKEKGVKVLFVEDTPEDMKKISEIIQKNTLVNFRKKFKISEKGLISKGIKFFADRNAAWIAKGQKASFFINEKIAITSQKTHQRIFHEIGHAKIAESKLLKNLLTVGKKLPFIMAPIGVCALAFTPKANNPKKPKSFLEKIEDYVDSHIGKIIFMSFMPLFVEKCIASRQSLRQAGKYLEKPKLQSLKKLYKIGVLTYFASAVAAAAGVSIGNKVQNNIIKQKQTPQDVYNLLI